MKFLIVALVMLAGCRPPINVTAPTEIRVDDVAVQSLTDEPEYVPTVRWNLYAYLPNRPLEILGYGNDIPNGDAFLDGHVFKWGGVQASISLENSRIRLDCSTGTAGTFTCLSDEGTMTATCERMVFKFTCSRK